MSALLEAVIYISDDRTIFKLIKAPPTEQAVYVAIDVDHAIDLIKKVRPIAFIMLDLDFPGYEKVLDIIESIQYAVKRKFNLYFFRRNLMVE